MEKSSGLIENRRKKVGIIGTGNYGIALGKRLLEYGFQVIYGSRNPNKEYLEKCLKTKDNYQVEGISDAFLKADRIVFFAVSARSGIYEKIVDNLNKAVQKMQGSRIVVELSNLEEENSEPSNAERLQNLFKNAQMSGKGLHVTVVKAFNHISAYSMGADHGEKKGTCEMVPIAGDDPDAKEALVKFCSQIGFQAHDAGSLNKARDLEKAEAVAFPDWATPTRFTFLFVVFNFIWSFFFTFIFLPTKRSFSEFLSVFSPLLLANKVLGFSALQLLAYVYLAGAVAALYQLYYGTKYRRFPKYLDAWLKSRKHLGLWAYFCAGIHVIMSLLLTNQNYMSCWFRDKNKFSKMTFFAEMNLIYGILAFAIMSILAMSSLSSVANSLNWREWRLVQSRVGFLCFVLATMHDTGMYIRYATDFEKNHTVTTLLTRSKLYACILPIAVIVLRLVLGFFPPVSRRLARIRNGDVNEIQA